MRLRARLLCAAAAFAVVTAPAAAETEADVSDVITVTAQKREQSLQDVPQSVDVLQGERLDAIRTGGDDILFLAAQSPSVYAEGSFGRTFPRFYIRGLGNTDFDLNANQPVSLVYDEVVLENPILKGFPVFDLDRIEVLRGPQGTLFGRNTPAGVIKFESARPTPEPEGYGRLSYATYDTIEAEGATSGPLSETVSIRLSGLYQRRDDYLDNRFEPGPEDAFGEFQDAAARLQVLFAPSDAAEFLFNIHGRALDGGSRIFYANAIQPGTGGLVPGFSRSDAAQDAVQVLEVENVGANLRATVDTRFGEITSVTAWESVTLDARGDVDGGFGAVFAPPSGPGFIPFSAETADNITAHDQYTQELRLAFSPREDVQALIGAFVFHEDLALENLSYDTLAGSAVNGLAVQDQETTAWAVFGNASLAATDRLTVDVGLRVSGEEKRFTAERLIGPFGAPPLGPLTRDLDDTVVSGDLSATWAFTDAFSVYARYARGFRAPNVQGRIVFGDVVTVADTETIDSLEAGFKRVFAGGRARLNGAAFYYETADQQLTAVGGAGNFNQLVNADQVVGYGFELDGAFSPLEGLDITAGLSLNETEIDDPDLEIAPCAAPCTVLDPINPANGNARIDGNPLPAAPRWIANATVRYGVPVRQGRGELYALADVAYRSEINFFLYESAEFRSDDSAETGLRLGYVHEEGAWEFALFGRNIFDETVIEGGVDFNNFTAFLNEPAIWGAEISARY